MLVVTRKKRESILIGDNIEIIIQEIDNGKVKIGIEAPKDIKILRKEVVESIKDENKEAIVSDPSLIERLLKLKM
ncbi:MAG: carbon storage regulator CsrA [Turicibacter sp.]